MKLACLLVVVVDVVVVDIVVVVDVVVVVVVVLLVVAAVVFIDLGSAALVFLHFDIKLPLSLTTTVGLDLLTRITKVYSLHFSTSSRVE